MKVSLSPDVILCGWLGLKHELTDLLTCSGRCLGMRVGIFSGLASPGHLLPSRLLGWGWRGGGGESQRYRESYGRRSSLSCSCRSQRETGHGHWKAIGSVPFASLVLRAGVKSSSLVGRKSFRETTNGKNGIRFHVCFEVFALFNPSLRKAEIWTD